MDRERATMKGGCVPFAVATRRVSLSLSPSLVWHQNTNTKCALSGGRALERGTPRSQSLFMFQFVTRPRV